MIPTVTGGVAADTITIADAHAHVWINPPPNAATRLHLDDAVAITTELRGFKAGVTGHALLVDCQPGNAGRDANRLAAISHEAGVYITATTGAHQRTYYPPEHPLWAADEDQITAYFIEELTAGTRESGGTIPAATIKIGYEGRTDGQTAVLMRAAAAASSQTGALILFHTERGLNIEALPPFFAACGVAAERLYICHVDKRPDFGLHQEMAQAGVLLGYDTFIRPKYQPEVNAWPLLERMVAAGYAGQVAMGLDMALREMWRSYGGGPGLRFYTEHILPRLASLGFDAATIHNLTAGNIVHRLDRV